MRIRALALALAALGSLHAEESAPAPTQTIDALVQQLGSEDFDVREAATRKLTDLGDAALPALKRLHEAAEDKEIKARLELLIWPLYAEVAQAEIHRGSANEKAIELDGRPSFKRNNSLDVKLNWRQIGGPHVDIQFKERLHLAYVPAQACSPGEYRFELVVTQGRKRSRPAVVTVIIDKAPAISLTESVETQFSRDLTKEANERALSVEPVPPKRIRGVDEPEE